MTATKPSFGFFTGNQNLGNVFKEQQQLNSKFFEWNWPLSDDEGHQQVNVGGKTRFIVLQGATNGNGFTGTEGGSAIKSFVETIELWVNANIQTTREYSDSLGRDPMNVYCMDFTWVRSFDDPNRILYTFLMKKA